MLSSVPTYLAEPSTTLASVPTYLAEVALVARPRVLLSRVQKQRLHVGHAGREDARLVVRVRSVRSGK